MDAAADEILKSHLGIDFSSARVLMILKSGQPMSQRALAGCLGQTPAAVTRSLPEFVRSGWIEISVDPKQPRRNLLTLTETGEALASRCWEILENSFSELAKAAQVDLTMLLGQIRALNSRLSAKHPWINHENI